MKKPLLLGLLGLFCFLLFALLQMPAGRALAWVEGLLEDTGAAPKLALYGVRGSIADGQADLLRWNELDLQRVRWRLSPLPLLRAGLGMTLAFRGDGSEGRTLVETGLGGGVRLSDTEVTLSVATLAEQWKGAPPSLGGTLHLDLDAAALEQGQIDDLRGTLEWRDARLGNEALGGFRLTVAPEGDDYKGILSDDGGPLQVEGVISLTADGVYRVVADIKLRDPKQAKLKTLLSLIAMPGADGAIPIRLDGRLALPGAAPVATDQPPEEEEERATG